MKRWQIVLAATLPMMAGLFLSYFSMNYLTQSVYGLTVGDSLVFASNERDESILIESHHKLVGGSLVGQDRKGRLHAQLNADENFVFSCISDNIVEPRVLLSVKDDSVSMELMDHNDVPRISYGEYNEGRISLDLSSQEGMEWMSLDFILLHVQDSFRPAVFAATNHYRSSMLLCISKGDMPLIVMRDVFKRHRLRIGIGEDGEPHIEMNDNNGDVGWFVKRKVLNNSKQKM